MGKKQRLLLIFLGILDCLVLGGLAGAIAFTPQIQAFLVGEVTPTAPLVPTSTPTLVRPATWTPTTPPTPAPTHTPRPTSTPAPTHTPFPTFTMIPTQEPTPEPVLLENAEFEDVAPDHVPGWEVAAVVNWQPGQVFDPGSSYARPEFKHADDSRRLIRGRTLQIQTFQWVKFQVTLYQTATVPAGSTVQFQIYTNGYSDEGGIQVRAGIDRNGAPACQNGAWSEQIVINAASGIVQLSSPRVVAGEDGVVTVCFYAEPQYAAIHNAAFFDIAELIVTPPE
ncbi:MAG: hypothetical protein JXD18_06435 [Anaerolineae bacterium]|nr:hypothetical protein [Anaerolineae bacterium]